MEVKHVVNCVKICMDNGFITCFGTSAKTNLNIDTAFKKLIVEIIEIDQFSNNCFMQK